MTKTQKFFHAIGMMVVGHNATLIARSVLHVMDERMKKRKSQ